MALITDATTTWSAPVTLNSDEIWQTRAGSIFVTTETNPSADDGLSVHENHAIQFPAGSTVRYRKVGVTEAVIVREAL